MALSREVYEALEDIVGPDNITEEPATLDSYAYQWMAELVPDVTGGSKFFDRPEAVLMPGSAEEVQAIVKACNRYKLKFHVFSTGWGPWAAAAVQGADTAGFAEDGSNTGNRRTKYVCRG